MEKGLSPNLPIKLECGSCPSGSAENLARASAWFVVFCLVLGWFRLGFWASFRAWHSAKPGIKMVDPQNHA